MRIHACTAYRCHPEPAPCHASVYGCEACSFKGSLEEAIVHIVKNQFVVPR